MISLVGVSRVYKGDSYVINALDNISVDFEENEFVAVMGKSGSGKSTLLSVVGALEKPDSGICTIDGVSTSEISLLKLDELRKQKISFVFQNFALIEEYTAYENIEIPLDAFNVDKKLKKEIIEDTMEMLGILKYKNKMPRQLSGGEQQRVAIARAFVKDSPYILADEPTGALDHSNSIELVKILSKLKTKGKTVIMVTHDEEIASYADRIIKLVDGRIEN